MKLSIDVWLYGAIRSLLINGATGARGAHGPYAYDALGRQTQATDAVGTTAFGYNAYGELETEAIAGLYTKTLTHHVDAYGRDAGYSVNGSRRATIGYDAATGRVATLNEGGVFRWAYLPGSDLKASLAYPNGLTAEWTYEPSRDLLTSVTNSLPDGTMLSAYAYTNDLLGRRTSKNDEQYGYDVRDELISADERTYAYDDIGNRTTAEGRAYTANSLNQYTAIDGFVPTFDADGNQTKVLTETGEWTVEYNAENRPVRWTQGSKVVTMGFDRMGRRVFYKEMEGSRQITHTVFLYNGYLCIQQLFSNSPWNVYKEFIWDPTEPLATRPLCFRQNGQRAAFLLHDGNKNVTDVVTVGPHNEPVAHYDYAPFGAITATGTRASHNPFRFSSEFHDDTLALTYYNYRHYNPKDGRWLRRDPIGAQGGKNLFGFVNNSLKQDELGRGIIEEGWTVLGEGFSKTASGAYYIGKVVQTHAGLMLLVPTSMLSGEVLNELQSENGRVPDFSEETGCRFNISVNGMANEDGEAFADLVRKKIQENVYPIHNPNNWTIPYSGFPLGAGDLLQSLFYEIGIPDVVSLHLSEAILAARAKGHENGYEDVCIVVYAHSQGTMVARRGFDLLKYAMDGEGQNALNDVLFCGYGGETRISADEYGLRNATNVSNPGDVVGWWGFIRNPTTKTEEGTGEGHPAVNYFP